MLIELNEEAVELIEDLDKNTGSLEHEEWENKIIKLAGIVTSKYLQEKIRIMATLECVK